MRIELVEHGQSEPLSLSPEQLSALGAVPDSALEVRPTFVPGLYRLCASAWVGEVSAPGLQVSIWPKVPTENLLAMLVETGSLPRWLEGTVSLNLVHGPLDLAAWAFLVEADRLIRQGMHRAYREEQENLPYVRGRLVVPEQIRVNLVNRHRTWCEYAEHTADVPENQVLRYLADRLMRLPLHYSELRRRLRRMQDALTGVSHQPVSAEQVARIALTRLTQRYRPAHDLAAFLLRHLTVEQGAAAGGELQAFLLDMNRLYEKYVTTVLKRELAGSALQVRDQRELHLDQEGSVRVRPDLVLETKGVPVAVADVKYKAPQGGKPVQADIYQVLAYAGRLGVGRAVLVYAGAAPAVLRIPSGSCIVEVQVVPFPIEGSRTELARRGQTLGRHMASLTPVP